MTQGPVGGFFKRNFYDNPHFYAYAGAGAMSLVGAWALKAVGYSTPLQTYAAVGGAVVGVLVLGSGIYAARRRFLRLEVRLADVITTIGQLTSRIADVDKSLAEMSATDKDLRKVIEVASAQMERSATSRALAVVESVDAIAAGFEGASHSEKDIAKAARDAAESISTSFGSLCSTNVRACIKVLEVPAEADAQARKPSPETVRFSRLASWPSSLGEPIELHRPLSASGPLSLLYQDDSSPHFIENDLESMRHIRVHTATKGSILVVRIATSSGMALGFLWLQSDVKNAFDPDLTPKLAKAFAGKLTSLLSALPMVSADNADSSYRRPKSESK